VANYSTNPNISNCTFVDNSADRGGGIYNESSDPNVSNCLFSNNEASLQGGGMYNLESDVTVSNCTFNGNSVHGPNSDQGYGGGISNNGSSLTVTNCTFIGNSVDGFYLCHGGGINNCGSNSIVTNCTFKNNSANGIIEGRGGGMCFFANSVLTNCIFIGNSATVSSEMGNSYGGGMANFYNSVVTNCILNGNSAAVGGGMYRLYNSVVSNCTLSGNLADIEAGGVHVLDDTAELSHCILWGNDAPNDPQIYGPLTLSYSDIQGGYPGIGNIDTDPCFADPGYWDPNGTPADANDDFWVNGDYHLKSQAGRYDPTTQSWVCDEEISPCIDAGDPMSPVGLEPFPNGGIINMGAYGATTKASKSYFGKPPCEIIVAGDVNGDCLVNFLDFRLMALHWCEDNNP
jgi:hypothetical protein